MPWVNDSHKVTSSTTEGFWMRDCTRRAGTFNRRALILCTRSNNQQFSSLSHLALPHNHRQSCLNSHSWHPSLCLASTARPFLSGLHTPPRTTGRRTVQMAHKLELIVAPYLEISERHETICLHDRCLSINNTFWRRWRKNNYCCLWIVLASPVSGYLKLLVIHIIIWSWNGCWP